MIILIITVILLAILIMFLGVVSYGFVLMGRNMSGGGDWVDEDLKNREWMKEHKE